MGRLEVSDGKPGPESRIPNPDQPTTFRLSDLGNFGRIMARVPVSIDDQIDQALLTTITSLRAQLERDVSAFGRELIAATHASAQQSELDELNLPVIDAGCGTGGFLSRLAGNYSGKPVIGLDLDFHACQRAAKGPR